MHFIITVFSFTVRSLWTAVLFYVKHQPPKRKENIHDQRLRALSHEATFTGKRGNQLQCMLKDHLLAHKFLSYDQQEKYVNVEM